MIFGCINPVYHWVTGFTTWSESPKMGDAPHCWTKPTWRLMLWSPSKIDGSFSGLTRDLGCKHTSYATSHELSFGLLWLLFWHGAYFQYLNSCLIFMFCVKDHPHYIPTTTPFYVRCLSIASPLRPPKKPRRPIPTIFDGIPTICYDQIPILDAPSAPVRWKKFEVQTSHWRHSAQKIPGCQCHARPNVIIWRHPESGGVLLKVYLSM